MRRTTSTSRLGSASRRPDVAPGAPPRRPAPPLISCSAAVSYTAPDADSPSSDPLESVSAGISAINLGPNSFRAGLNNNGNDANRKRALGHIPQDKASTGFAEGEREAHRSVRIQAAHPKAFPTDLRPFSPPPPSSFLEACFLCKRRLRPGNDIFMYRGDQAFCSIECRCHQIEADERKEKCRIASVKKGTGAPPSNPTTNGQQVGSSETAAVA